MSTASASLEAPSIQSILTDLTSRFFVNLPEEERSFERLFVQLQQAHWFYMDCYYDRYNKKLPKFQLKSFCQFMFKNVVFLQPFQSRFEELYSQFCKYLSAVPVNGCILLNVPMTRCVLVRGWGNDGTWSFPRGKVNKGENSVECAVREVLEEVGYDASRSVDSNVFIEAIVSGRKTRLYIVRNVEERSEFKTHTRKEIGAIGWFDIDSLPSGSKGQSQSSVTVATGKSKDSKKFWNVVPFVRRLKTWIGQNRHPTLQLQQSQQQQQQQQQQPRQRSQPDDNHARKNGSHRRRSSFSEQLAHEQLMKLSSLSSLSPSPAAFPQASSSAFTSFYSAPPQPLQPVHAQPSSGGHPPRHPSNYRERSRERDREHDVRREDMVNDETFGSGAGPASGWSAEQMFAANEKLFGVKAEDPEPKVVITPEIEAHLSKFLPPRQLQRALSSYSYSPAPPQPQRSQSTITQAPVPQLPPLISIAPSPAASPAPDLLQRQRASSNLSSGWPSQAFPSHAISSASLASHVPHSSTPTLAASSAPVMPPKSKSAPSPISVSSSSSVSPVSPPQTSSPTSPQVEGQPSSRSLLRSSTSPPIPLAIPVMPSPSCEGSLNGLLNFRFDASSIMKELSAFS